MPKLVLIRRWRDGHTFTTLIRETHRTKRRVYGELVAGDGAALTADGYAPLSAVLCENATQAQFDAIRKAEADYSRTMGMARQRLAEERDVAYARLEAAIRKAIGRKVRASTGRPHHSPTTKRSAARRKVRASTGR